MLKCLISIQFKNNVGLINCNLKTQMKNKYENKKQQTISNGIWKGYIIKKEIREYKNTDIRSIQCFKRFLKAAEPIFVEQEFVLNALVDSLEEELLKQTIHLSGNKVRLRIHRNQQFRVWISIDRWKIESDQQTN